MKRKQNTGSTQSLGVMLSGICICSSEGWGDDTVLRRWAPFLSWYWAAILYLEFFYMHCCFWCGVIFSGDRTFYWPQTRALTGEKW